MQTITVIDKLLSYTCLSVQELIGASFYEQAKSEFEEFLTLLESGEVRVARKNHEGCWVVNADIKKVILLGFRLGQLVAMGDQALSFVDKDTFPIRQFHPDQKIRLVPGGVSVRRGTYVAQSVIIMPPSFINVGAFVDEGTMVDSHALVGSCAQIGKRVHLSAGVQVGGVLEPIGELPVVIEDDVFIGGNSGVYEGTHVGHRAVIGAGVILTKSSRVYDLVNECTISASEGVPLQIPANAVVVAGSRKIKGQFAEEHGLSLNAPIIVKYRDDKTDAKTALEHSLRS